MSLAVYFSLIENLYQLIAHDYLKPFIKRTFPYQNMCSRIE